MSEDYLNEEDIVYRVFNEIQGYPRKIEQFAEILSEVYCHRPEEFVQQFSSCIYIVLAYKSSGKDVDNLIQFVSTVVSRCTGTNLVPNLAPLIIEDLLAFTKTKDRHVRQRCLQLVNQILVKSKTLDLEERLLKKLKQVYIERSRDKVIAVRLAAAFGLCSLQNSQSPDQEVLSMISKNIDCESAVNVRRIYAQNILVHPITMESVQRRLRDEDLTVRLDLLHNLESHSIIQQLSIALRHAVIHCLQDRNEVIVKAAESIILNNWVKHNSLYVLLSLIDFENDELMGELLLNSVFLHDPESRVLVKEEGISTLRSFFLYSLVRFLFEQKHESDIDVLIPDIPQFCDLVRECARISDIDKTIQSIVFRNYIRCLQYIDVSDDVCRSIILNLVRNLFSLPSGSQNDLIINSQNVHTLLQSLLSVLDSEFAFISEVSLLLSDLEDEMTEKSSDDIMLLALYIVQSTFKLISSYAFNQPELRSFFDRIITPNLQSSNSTLRCEAVKGLVLMAIMNKNVAFQYSSLLLCMILEEDESLDVKTVAMNGLTDIVITHGDLKSQASQDMELGVSVSEIMDALNMYVFHTNESLQQVTCECFCRLFMFDKTRSVLFLSNLLLLFDLFCELINRLFDTSTQQRAKVRQILSVFFPSFCSPEIDKNCLFLEEAAIFTIKGIMEASIPDRYSMISQIGQFFLLIMVIDSKRSEKRNYIASDDEEESNDPNDGSNQDVGDGENGPKDRNHENKKHYHRSVMVFLDKLMNVSESKWDDSAFMREVVLVFGYLDADYFNKSRRSQVNDMLQIIFEKVTNQSLKRQIKAKNKTLCTLDPSLTKL